MLIREQNERVTQTGPGTPAGSLMRRYWQPAALVEELHGERSAVPVRLLGEDLVLYREETGGYALLGRRCPHRGVDLAYGRLEDGGLRCPFHGWLFDGTGRCLEQPAEPEGSTFHTKIRHTAYPCLAKNGIVFAWMGAGEPPPLPAFDCMAAPDDYSFAFKGLIEANWLQAVEVGIDPAHASFLHRYFEDEDPDQGYGQQFRDRSAGTDVPLTKLLRENPRPDIRVEETGYGLRITSLRNLGNTGTHVRVTNLAFPNAIVIPLSTDMVLTQWHVPVDDESCYWYGMFTDFRKRTDKRTMREQRIQLYDLPDYRPKRGKANGYGYNPVEQRTKTYTGMGMDINVHDNWAVESPGPIFDRTREHLGASDRAITANRKLLMAAIDAVEKGSSPTIDLATCEAPLAVDTLAVAGDWRAHWRTVEADRRSASPWASKE